MSAPASDRPETVRGGCPLECPDACSWEVTVRNGAAERLRGTREHPFTRGTLCVKVNRYLEHTRSPDRLLHPLRRRGAKGAGEFVRISWDEALDEIAGRLRDVCGEHGGEAVWPYYGTGTVGYLQGHRGMPGRRLFNLLGASRHDMNICSAAGNAGMAYTLGTPAGMDPEALRHSKLILLWGTNTLTSGHHLWKFVRESGAHVVVIDPLRTRTADQADEHLAPVPGTDAALALGLLHVVVRQGAEDTDFLARHTLGWEAFKERIAGFPPARVAAITGIPEHRIEALGDRLARTRPTAVRAAQGLQRHAGGGTVLRTLACIPAVTGDWRHAGGGAVFSTTAHFGLDVRGLTRDDLLPREVRTLRMTRLAEGLLDLDDPPVKALFLIAANPAASTPDSARVLRGLARDDLFTVAIEQFATDSTDYADIVLPTTMQTEHADLISGYGHLYLTWNEPAVEAPPECLPATEIFRRLARRMGRTEPAVYASDLDLAAQALRSGHPHLEGITLDSLRERGWARLNVPEPFAPFAHGFPTPSGRLEFWSERALADGHDPLAGYVPAAETPDAERAGRFPFVLLSVASHFFLNTVFGNNPELRRRAGPPTVLVHPRDAEAAGLDHGARARVRNERGGFTATVEVSDRVRPGVAATTKGHWAKLGGGGAQVNSVVAERDADMGAGAVFHDTRVAIEPEHEHGR